MTQAFQAEAVLDSQRGLFDIPEGVTYLNCANMSPQLREVTAAGIAAVRARTSPWTVAAPDWFSGAEHLRDLFARVVSADADGVALVPSVSYGIATAAANVNVARGQSILLLDQEFPSNVYSWRELARRRRAQIRTVRRQPEGSWTAAVLAGIDARTAVIAVPNCHWTDGSRIDLTRVGDAARSVGAALVVDASQSLGAYPLDVSEVRPDFLVTVGYKWLMGPYGLSYLYVAPSWRERGIPLEQSWLARAGSDDFSRLLDYRDDYRNGARRFDMGASPQFVLAPMAIVALERILAWGVERIQRTLSMLVSRVASCAAEMGAFTVPAAERMGHLTGIRLAGGLPGALPGALAEARVFVSVRGDSIRVAPHLYNDRSDIDRFLDVLRQCASTAPRGARERDPDARAGGTRS